MEVSSQIGTVTSAGVVYMLPGLKSEENNLCWQWMPSRWPLSSAAQL